MLDAQLLPAHAIVSCPWSMQQGWNPRDCRTIIGIVAKEGR